MQIIIFINLNALEKQKIATVILARNTPQLHVKRPSPEEVFFVCFRWTDITWAAAHSRNRPIGVRRPSAEPSDAAGRPIGIDGPRRSRLEQKSRPARTLAHFPLDPPHFTLDRERRWRSTAARGAPAMAARRLRSPEERAAG